MRVLRIVLGIIGWLLVAGAAVMAVREAMMWAQSGAWTPIAAGQLWFDIHKDSLQLVQPAPRPQRQEGGLRDLDVAVLAHPLLAFLLLVEKLALARHVAAVALGGDVLAQRRDRLARGG